MSHPVGQEMSYRVYIFMTQDVIRNMVSSYLPRHAQWDM